MIGERLPLERTELERSIPERFARVAERWPDRPAVDGALSYGELDARSNHVAASVAGGDGPVLVVLGDPVDELVALLGVLKAGRPVVVAPAATAAALGRELGVDDVLGADRYQRGATAGPVDRRVEAGAPASIVVTSGTTGTPRAIVRSHRCILHRVRLHTEAHAVGPGDRQSHLFSASYVAAEVDVLGALLSGATLCPFPLATRGFGEVSTWLREREITLLHPPVSWFRRYLASLEQPLALPSLRLVALAGEPVRGRDVALAFARLGGDAAVEHRYSSTETSNVGTYLARRGDPLGDGPLPFRPVADKEVRLLHDGELQVTSAYLASGYWRDPERTAQRFVAQPDGRVAYRTGDRARLLPDGALVILGRRDRRLKIRGHRVEPEAVEAALADGQAVREAAVIAGPGDLTLLAFVVAAGAERPSDAELRARLGATLPEALVPSRFEWLPALPLTATGKVDHAALAARPAPTTDAPPPDELGRLWLEVVGGPHDDFKAAGGTSLSAAALLSAVEKRWPGKVTVQGFLRDPTRSGLARALAAPGQAAASLLVRLASRERGPAVLLIPGVGGFVLTLRELAARLATVGPVYGASFGDGAVEVTELARRIHDEARRELEPGPIHVLGYSFGGVLAHEVARLLVADGVPVVSLILVDSHLPGAVRWRSRGARLAGHARLLLSRDPRVRRQHLGRLLTLLHGRLVRKKNPAIVAWLRDVHSPSMAAKQRALLRHRPQRFPGRLTLLASENQARSQLAQVAPLLGWQGLAESIEVHPVPGEHDRLLFEPAVEKVAQVILDCMTRRTTP